MADVVMEAPKNLALCLVCNKDLGPLNQIPTFYHRPNVLFSRTPATSTLLRHKLESIVKDIVVFRSETCCLCVKCAGLINLADALEAELQSVCRQLTDHYWRTARLRGFGEERAVVCITPVQPRRPTAAPATAAGAAAGAAAGTAAGTAAGAAAGTAAGTAAGAAVPGGGPPSLLQQPGRPPVWTPQPAAGWAPQAGPPPGQPPAIWAGRPGPGQVTRSVSQDSDDASGVCQLLSAVEVELTEVKQEPGDELDVNNHLMRDPVDIEVDPWKDLGYEDANAVEKLASQKTRNMPPPSQFGQVRWPGQPPPWAAAPVGPLGAAPPAAPPGPRPTGAPPPPYSWPGSSPAAPRAPQPRTYGAHCRLDMSQVGRVPSAERPLPPPELPPGAQKTHQRIMKTLTSHSSAIQQAVANGVLSLEVRPPGTAAAAAAAAVAVAVAAVAPHPDRDHPASGDVTGTAGGDVKRGKAGASAAADAGGDSDSGDSFSALLEAYRRDQERQRADWSSGGDETPTRGGGGATSAGESTAKRESRSGSSRDREESAAVDNQEERVVANEEAVEVEEEGDVEVEEVDEERLRQVLIKLNPKLVGSLTEDDLCTLVGYLKNRRGADCRRYRKAVTLVRKKGVFQVLMLSRRAGEIETTLAGMMELLSVESAALSACAAVTASDKVAEPRRQAKVKSQALTNGRARSVASKSAGSFEASSEVGAAACRQSTADVIGSDGTATGAATCAPPASSAATYATRTALGEESGTASVSIGLPDASATFTASSVAGAATCAAGGATAYADEEVRQMASTGEEAAAFQRELRQKVVEERAARASRQRAHRASPAPAEVDSSSSEETDDETGLEGATPAPRGDYNGRERRPGPPRRAPGGAPLAAGSGGPTSETENTGYPSGFGAVDGGYQNPWTAGGAQNESYAGSWAEYAPSHAGYPNPWDQGYPHPWGGYGPPSRPRYSNPASNAGRSAGPGYPSFWGGYPNSWGGYGPPRHPGYPNPWGGYDRPNHAGYPDPCGGYGPPGPPGYPGRWGQCGPPPGPGYPARDPGAWDDILRTCYDRQTEYLAHMSRFFAGYHRREQ